MATAFVRAANPIWYMVDLTGEPLDDTYFAFFLQNEFPYLPQNIYQDISGTIPWANPLQFNANGTLPDNLYFNDSLVYRIEIRHGNSQSDPLIYEVNNFVPGNGNGNESSSGSIATDNQISNSQFSMVDFQGTLSISAAGDYDVAPGWVLTCIGIGGTASISQVVSVSNQNQINNPPYTLRIVTNNFSEVYLTQRFNNNGAIWSSVTDQQEGVVSMSITATSSSGDYNVSLYYVPSQTSNPVPLIAAGIIESGDFQVLDGSAVIPPSDNTDDSDDAYVDMRIVLEGTGTIEISNVQCIGQSLPEGSALPDPIVYQQETIERQTDHLFHYYKNSLLLMPKKSILTGWSFSLNPYQFITSTLTIVSAQTQYIADQTILHQDGASLLLSGKASDLGNRSGLEIKANAGAASNSRLCLIQYIDPSTTLPYWSYKLSGLVKASLFSSNSSSIQLKMRLIYRTGSLPPTISAVQPIASWASGQDPTLAAGWSYINSINDPSFTMEINSGSFDFPEYSFNGFQLPDNSNAIQVLGIMVYTMEPLIRTGTADYIVFDKISLVPNEFSIDGSIETFDQSLRDCQFYYEKSYDDSILPGTATESCEIIRLQTAAAAGGTSAYYSNAFEFEFNTVKRAVPTLSLYNPITGTINQVRVLCLTTNTIQLDGNVASTGWNYLAGTKSALAIPNASTQFTTSGVLGQPLNNACYIKFHYVADARLGR